MINYKEEDDLFVPLGPMLDMIEKYLSITPEYFPDELTDQDIEDILLAADPEKMPNPVAFKIFVDYYIHNALLTDLAEKYNETRSHIKWSIKKAKPFVAKYITETAKNKIVPKFEKQKWAAIGEAFNVPNTVIEYKDIEVHKNGKTYTISKRSKVHFKEDGKYREKHSYGGRKKANRGVGEDVQGT